MVSDAVDKSVDKKLVDLPWHYGAFTRSLANCSLPLQKKRGHHICYCPLSRKPDIIAWRNENKLHTDGRYIPYCGNYKLLKDEPLLQHLRSTPKMLDDAEISWHDIVSNYLAFLRQGYTNMGIV